MKVVGIIPARYGSSRFPGKPLVDIAGKSMTQRVYEQAKKANLSDVIVATDDQRIFDEVITFGGKVVMTSNDHPSGTDRCLETLEKLKEKYDAVINIQGDEPFIQPEQIDKVANCFRNPSTQIATLAKAIKNESVLLDVNSPKVSFNDKNIALTFSRKVTIEAGEKYFKHIGIYGYRTDVLREITQLAQSKNEISERLEQLRWLDNGYKIRVELTELETISIDTPEDLKKIEGLA
ncbi:MAG: 3-deoxy-manno-octulosonate cytidylyltransferase [Bacteroidetes bacterium]|nr:3-deoxy-manno-octulosonate cytidylyltransferase [Bacteroidota bacterium]